MAYITTEEVKAIRTQLKAEFGKDFKFSVRKSTSLSSVCVTILKSPLAFTDVLTYKDPATGELITREYSSVNHYNIENFYKNAEEVKVLSKINEIILTAPTSVTGEDFYDESDTMTDYFNVSFYYDIEVGHWDKPYIQTGV